MVRLQEASVRLRMLRGRRRCGAVLGHGHAPRGHLTRIHTAGPPEGDRRVLRPGLARRRSRRRRGRRACWCACCGTRAK